MPPAAPMSAPLTVSLVSGRSGVATSCSAAIGGIREARSAGRTAATHRHEQADHERADHRGGGDADAGEGDAADVAEHPGEQDTDADAGGQAEDRGDETDRDGLDE